MITYCKECSKKFTFGPDNPDDLRGLRTRKLCDTCRVERKRTESRNYQRQKRLNISQMRVL